MTDYLLRWVKKTSPNITEATPEDWKDFWYSPEANGTWGIAEEKEVSPELQFHLDRIKHLEEEITKYKQEISILKIYLEDVVMTSDQLREQLITNVEEYFCERITDLFDDERPKDADSFFKEFVVNGAEPEEWAFINDLTNVQ